MNVEYHPFRLSAAKPVLSASSDAAPKWAGRRHLSSMLVRMILSEFLVAAGAAYLASVLYNWIILERWPPADQYVTAAILVAVLVLVAALGFRQFAAIQTQPRHRFLWSGLGAVALAFSVFLSLLFLLKIAEWYSRGTFFVQFFGVALAVLALRTLTYSQMQAAIASGLVEARRAILIGDISHYAAVIDLLKDAGIQTVGSFPFPAGIIRGRLDIEPARGNDRCIRDMIDSCRALRADDILILATSNDLPRTSSLADILTELPVSLHVIPVDIGNLLASSRLAELGSTATIQILHPPLSTFDKFLKRAFDVTAGIVGLIMLSPLLLIVSIAIKLDSRGPAFFRQKRHGYNNDSIQVFKFRTMITMEDGAKFTQARKNDPRVTRIGRILRKTNIDEVPQLLNVLSGEMSIVGPRPHPIALDTKFEEQIPPLSRRHNVKPGITGWAQVNGFRGETDTLEKMERRIEYDLYYIDNWSFFFDLKVILMTLFSKRAYMNAC